MLIVKARGTCSYH